MDAGAAVVVIYCLADGNLFVIVLPRCLITKLHSYLVTIDQRENRISFNMV